MGNHHPAEGRHAGRGAIAWARQSDKEQSKGSCNDQIRTAEGFAQTRGIRIIGEMTLDGVSGSSSRVAQAIQELIARKRERQDFDLLIVHDLSRLSRGGVTTAHHLMYLLAEAGIEVLSVHDDNPGGEFGEMFDSLKHMASQQQAKSISLAQTRGAMSAILSGKTSVIRNPPFGVDRMVVGPDDQPRFVLHLAPDGTQRVLDPTDRRELKRYGRDQRGAAFYRKQLDERIDLCPGEPIHLETVHRMFALYDLEGYGYHRTTRWLNDHSIPSPTGGSWAKSSVRNILNNPLYVGLVVGHRQTFARYYCRDKQGPKPVDRPLSETAGRLWLSARPRPLDEWAIDREPALRDLLPRPLRRVARRRILRGLREEAQGKRGPKATPPRRKPSEFILTNRIHSRQSGLPMSGRNTGKTSAKTKYYGVTKARNQPQSGDKTSRRLVPAAPLHQLVIGMLRHVLRDLPGLKERVRREAHAKIFREGSGDGMDLLRHRRQTLLGQINLLVEHLDRFALSNAEQKIRALTAELEAVDRRLEEEPDQPTRSPADIDRAVDAAFAQLQTAADFVRRFGRPALDQLLDVLLAKAVVDQETRFVEIEFRLPAWALDAPERLCREVSRARTGGPEAQPLTEPQAGFLLRRVMAAWLDEGMVGVAA